VDFETGVGAKKQNKDKMTTTKMDQNKNVTCYISVIQIRIYR